MLKIARKDLGGLFAALNSQAKLFVPLSTPSGANFGPWRQGASLALGTLLTTKSAKDVFFPQVEALLRFQSSGKELVLEPQELPVGESILFGVRACDVRSFEVLDKVFLAEPTDRFYEERRRHTVLISMACSEPSETCFCHAFGIDAANPGGDIETYLVGSELYWQAKSEKGQALTEAVRKFFTEAEAAPVQAQQQQLKTSLAQLPLADFHVPESWTQSAAVFASDSWSHLSEACLGCGICTFVCPTCHCYDVRDFANKGEVSRYRCWDSCMYSDFTKMAGSQPRTTQKERFRQRFMHKLVYFPENNAGMYACVGCGRCLEKCPVCLNIVKVAKALVVKDNV